MDYTPKSVDIVTEEPQIKVDNAPEINFPSAAAITGRQVWDTFKKVGNPGASEDASSYQVDPDKEVEPYKGKWWFTSKVKDIMVLATPSKLDIVNGEKVRMPHKMARFNQNRYSTDDKEVAIGIRHSVSYLRGDIIEITNRLRDIERETEERKKREDNERKIAELEAKKAEEERVAKKALEMMPKILKELGFTDDVVSIVKDGVKLKQKK